ncbi:protein of unknown function [Methylocaldum szegediense]|uniref:Integrase catalytic domain-containing protein n=1 Tax=Methylocaldum szegediense TaxID=73780 RepID=A0ABM9I5C7_9GAMM|nr:protein of unknown function [Methylocaldum szegediense]
MVALVQIGLDRPHQPGLQYASNAYLRVLECYDFVYTRRCRGECSDNAAMESFFPCLKV